MAQTSPNRKTELLNLTPSPRGSGLSDELFRELDPTIAIFHLEAGTNITSGIATYIRKLSSILAERTNTIIYTRDGVIEDSISKSSAKLCLFSHNQQNRDQSTMTLLDRVRLYSKTFRDIKNHIQRYADIIITFNIFDYEFISNIVDIPTIWVCNDFRQARAKANIEKMFSQSNLIATTTEKVFEQIKNNTDHEPLGVVPPGVNTDIFHPDRKPAFESSDVSVLFVGNSGENKGINCLLEAIAQADGSYSVHLVGTTQEKRIRQKSYNLGISESVSIHGVIDHFKLPHYFCSADIVCNTTYNKSFSLVDLEAMACKTPIISTDPYGTKDYLIHGVTGLKISQNDSEKLAEFVGELGSSPEFRSELGRAAKNKAIGYSWESTVSIYQEICYRLYSSHYNTKPSEWRPLIDHY